MVGLCEPLHVDAQLFGEICYANVENPSYHALQCVDLERAKLSNYNDCASTQTMYKSHSGFDIIDFLHSRGK